MSLRSYQLPRMVVLSPSDTVLEAARAIENNSIGAIVVVDAGPVVGLLTDRDLAVRVVGRGLDPRLTMICDVMTSPVSTLSPSDSHEDAIRLMQQKRIRRIPLVECRASCRHRDVGRFVVGRGRTTGATGYSH